MAAETQSSREIERELEAERAELASTIDEIWNRLTFEDAWNRIGLYIRDNGSSHGKTLGRLAREKPIGVALTAIGVAWLLFGPSSNPPRLGMDPDHPHDGFGGDAVRRDRLAEAGRRGHADPAMSRAGRAATVGGGAGSADRTSSSDADHSDPFAVSAAASGTGDTGSRGSGVGARPASTMPPGGFDAKTGAGRDTSSTTGAAGAASPGTGSPTTVTPKSAPAVSTSGSLLGGSTASTTGGAASSAGTDRAGEGAERKDAGTGERSTPSSSGARP